MIEPNKVDYYALDDALRWLENPPLNPTPDAPKNVASRIRAALGGYVSRPPLPEVGERVNLEAITDPLFCTVIALDLDTDTAWVRDDNWQDYIVDIVDLSR